jgi:hypothetical protein
MDTIVKRTKRVGIPKTFTAKEAGIMDVQHVQLNIPLSFYQVVDIVRQLSPYEKQQLGEVLWTEQSVDDIVITEEHKRMVRERIKKYENNPSSYLSWNDIECKMANRK